jgi:nitroreductase
MKLLELLNNRQSTRDYLETPIPRDAIERCLEAARIAPSACNSQPWHFIVIDNQETKNEVADAAFSGIYFTNSFAKKAPVLIVVVTERSSYLARVGGQFRGIQYSLIDIGISCEHLILQANEEGLGSCWLGWFNEKGVKKVLNLPEKSKVDVLISLGYSKNKTLRQKTRKSMDEIRKFI